MIQKISAPVSVLSVFDHQKQKVYPKIVLWAGKRYPILKIGLHHTYREGKTLYHVFSVEGETFFFRLVLNTDNLFWRLEEIADGQPE